MQNKWQDLLSEEINTTFSLGSLFEKCKALHDEQVKELFDEIDNIPVKDVYTERRIEAIKKKYLESS